MTDYRIKWHVEVLEKLVVDFGPSPVRECLSQILEEKRAVLDGTGVVVEALTDPTEDAAPIGAQARVERAEAARDAFEGRAKTAEALAEAHSRIAQILQNRIRDIHTKLCGDDGGMGSPDEHHAAILAECDRLRAELAAAEAFSEVVRHQLDAGADETPLDAIRRLRAERDARPEITAEDAAAALTASGQFSDPDNVMDEWAPVLAALRDHARKAVTP